MKFILSKKNATHFRSRFSNHDALEFRGNAFRYSSVFKFLLKRWSDQFLLHLHEFFFPPKIAQRSHHQPSESFRLTVRVKRSDHVIPFILGNRRGNLQNARAIFLLLNLNPSKYELSK